MNASYAQGLGDEVLFVSTFLVLLLSTAFVFFRGWIAVRVNNVVSNVTGHGDGLNRDDISPGSTSPTGGDGDGHSDESGHELPTAPAGAETSGGGGGRRRGVRRSPSNDSSVCAICMDQLRLPVQTNCGHWFCATCLLAYRNHGNPMVAMLCPMCRQTVTLLFDSFDVSDDTANSLRSHLRSYNRRFSEDSRPWLDYVRDVPTLFRHLWHEFFSVGGLVLMFRLRVLVCFLSALFYLLSPLDLLPELILGPLGLIDDLFVVLMLTMYVSAIYRRYVANRL